MKPMFRSVKKPTIVRIRKPLDDLIIGQLYIVSQLHNDKNVSTPLVYLGFGQDETVEYVKTGHIFLNVEKCAKTCIQFLPADFIIKKLE